MKKLEPKRGNDSPNTMQEVIMQVEDQSPALLTSCPQFSRCIVHVQLRNGVIKLWSSHRKDK